MVTVLVTGGAGYVGSHACKELARAGHRPVTYDDLSRGHRELVKWGPLAQGDIRDAAALRAALRQHRPAAVMHFAALSYVDESVRLPLAYYDINVRGALALLTAMRDEGVNRIVFSSSCSVYDQDHLGPLDEGAPLAPLHPYGQSKAMVEQVLRDAAAGGLASVALRYFNASGADPDGETGEWHDPETHLIPRLLDAAAGNDPEFRINGVDYATPDGTCVRDYIHVSDLARAHVRAIAFLEDHPGAHVFNLGTGAGTSVRAMIRTAEAVTGRTIKVVEGPRRAGDATSLVADVRKAARDLGWTAQVTAVADHVRDAWRWHQR